ncbi:MAG: 16S rRNA (guanine(966)-N(2))-methyltransferase RsmD [Jiangellaceae bacterium]
MTRIIAGAARGRRLLTPAGSRTRPTSDRVREAMFSALESELGAFAGLRVLDLYAGTGALGLEALSRGAAHVLLVEADARAARTIRSNVSTVGLPGAEVVQSSVVRALTAVPPAPYDLVLADPPYVTRGEEIELVLAQLTGGWLAPQAIVVVERSTRDAPLGWPAGMVGQRTRRYGETMLWYGRPAG